MDIYQAALVRRFESYLRLDLTPPVDLAAKLLAEGLDPTEIEENFDTTYTQETH